MRVKRESARRRRRVVRKSERVNSKNLGRRTGGYLGL